MTFDYVYTFFFYLKAFNMPFSVMHNKVCVYGSSMSIGTNMDEKTDMKTNHLVLLFLKGTFYDSTSNHIEAKKKC